jgi:parvulin-like peptidyl-prolyl isomerase
MTFRSRPAPSRARSRQSSRKTLYTNLLFGGIIVFALLILAIAGGVNWWANHLQPVATVNGDSISRDDFTNRVRVDLWRLNAVESRVRDAATNGLITNEQRDQEIAQLNQEKGDANSVYGSSIQSLMDSRLQAQLAAQLGITVTDADVDARLLKEATTQEQRHAFIMEIAPTPVAPSNEPTDETIKAALTRAQALLARLNKGEEWAAVAKDSADPPPSDNGDQGFITKDQSTIDAAILSAIFALPASGHTDIVKGADGTFRIAQVTRIVPMTVNEQYQQNIINGGVPIDVYRQAVRADAIRDAVKARIVADDTTKESVQRHVLEIKLEQQVDQQTNQPILTDEVEVRHILYAPGGKDAVGSPPPPSTDPGWADAKAKADATYQLLLKDPARFSDIAKSDSADTASAADGGDIGYQSQSALDPQFGAAIFKAGLTKGEILPPVLSVYGWHVIQFVDRRTPARTRMEAFAEELKKPGTDFATIARANSEAADAKQGGDMGWVAHHQVSELLDDAIFAIPVGGVSTIIPDGTTLYLFKVLEERTRLPDKDQIDTLTASAFQNWYAAQQHTAKIEVDPAFQQYLQSSGG